jgi:hypothetical protein
LGVTIRGRFHKSENTASVRIDRDILFSSNKPLASQLPQRALDSRVLGITAPPIAILIAFDLIPAR